MLRRHIVCQRDGQAACLIRNKCRGRVIRRPYVRLRPPAYVTRSRPRGSIGSPPGRGAVAQADRSARNWVQTRVVIGPPPGSCPRPVHVLSWDLAMCGPDPAQGGPGPVPGVRACLWRFCTLLGGPIYTYRGPTLFHGVPDQLLILEYIVFSGRVATRESTTWWGRALFTTRLEVAAWAPRLHTVVRGTPVSWYRHYGLQHDGKPEFS
jgi:hypothetical protein